MRFRIILCSSKRRRGCIYASTQFTVEHIENRTFLTNELHFFDKFGDMCLLFYLFIDIPLNERLEGIIFFFPCQLMSSPQFITQNLSTHKVQCLCHFLWQNCLVIFVSMTDVAAFQRAGQLSSYLECRKIT